VSSGATEVEETSLGKDDDTMTIGELVAVNLLLDVDALDTGVFVKTFHVDFVIEVTDVSNNGVVLHLGHMLSHDDALVSGGSDIDVGSLQDRFDSLDLVTFHASLEGANGIAFSDDNSSSASLHGLSATFADITETEDDNLFTSNHDVSGSHETIGKRVSATINVVELLLGDAIVNVDSLEEEFTSLSHLFESKNTSGGLFGDTVETSDHVSPF
jgi:hypothetical protein